MKKIIAFVITIAMVLSIAAVPAFAINPMTISGSDAGEVLLTAGGQFDVTVTLGNNPGVAGVSVDVTWSKTDLKLVNCALGTVLPNDSTVTGAISTNTGKHVLSLGNMLATENYTANGVIATLTFEILSTATKGEKSIGLAVQNDDEYNILDAAMNPVATTFTAGKVTLVKAKHNVVFNPANGGESTTVAVEDGSTVAKPTDPQKEGSDFVEWQLNNAAYDFSAPVTAAIELTATYKIKTFKVTFVTAHGTAPAEQTVNWNETANKPADPSEENWQFDGWVTTDGGSTAFDFSTPIKADTQVYAAWTKLHVHQPVPTVAKAPTCTEPGNNAYYTCSDDDCKKVFKDEACTQPTTVEAETLAALNHQWGDISYVWAEDFSKVDASVTCTRTGCGLTVTDTATPTKDTEASVKETCTENGKDVYTATFTKDPFTKQTKEKVINKLGHSMTPTVAKDATCTEAGNSAYYTCGNCNKVFKDEQGNDETSVEEATIAALGHLPGNDTTVTWTGDTAKIAFTCQREGCGLAVNEDAEVTAEDNILIASYNGVAYDKKHKDSTTNVGAVGTVKDENGQEIAAAAVTAEEITDTDLPDNNLLDPQKAAAVEGEHTADQMDVVWQKEVKVAGTTGPVTMTFTVSGVGSTQKIFVFHFTAGAWKIEAEGEEGAGSVTVTLGDLSPIALVVASTAPPATGDSSSTFIWAGAMVMAACAAAYVVMTSKRGKHEA